MNEASRKRLGSRCCATSTESASPKNSLSSKKKVKSTPRTLTLNESLLAYLNLVVFLPYFQKVGKVQKLRNRAEMFQSVS